MAWKTFDFSTGTELNRAFVARLRQFLERKESQLAHDTIHTLDHLTTLSPLPRLPIPPSSKVRFSQGVDEFGRKIHETTSMSAKNVPSDEWKRIAGELNHLLWGHVEFLEGAITELFFEVGRIDLQMWSLETMEVVQDVKHILSASLDESEVGINGLNQALVDLRNATDGRKWSISRLLGSDILDAELLTSIRNSRKALVNGYEKFTKIYDNITSIKEQIVAPIIRIGTMPVFSTLDPDDQQKFLDLYELLKYHEKNQKSNLFSERDVLMALRKSMSREKAFMTFRDYYHGLHRELFRQSLALKKSSPELASKEVRDNQADSLKEIQQEVVLLGSVIDQYREFLLSTDPNPYVRTRMGFAEWVLGPESQETKNLYRFGYNVESLNRLYARLIDSLDHGYGTSLQQELLNKEQIEKVLHELSAPLLSEKIMENRLKRLVELFEETDELASFNPFVVHDMGIWLEKAMRADWRHHILHRIPKFHEVYAIHLGLAEDGEDKLHNNRLSKFRKVLWELKGWIVKRETVNHTGDIELDINDIRGYLQEFYAHVQRCLGDNEKKVEMFMQQLLEYRYLFGYFFHQLNEENTEEYLIRSQFYFVDQYFEAVDKKLQESISDKV